MNIFHKMECSKITLENYKTKILQFKMHLEIILKVVQIYVVNLKKNVVFNVYYFFFQLLQ